MARRVKKRKKANKLPGATRTVFGSSRYFLEKKETTFSQNIQRRTSLLSNVRTIFLSSFYAPKVDVVFKITIGFRMNYY
jgi:hypothetical protein